MTDRQKWQIIFSSGRAAHKIIGTEKIDIHWRG